eukprot:CAMPEP_0205827422 /NCGR_PEP_ID=MMETSP0206-20130828/31942_1 /ASSEMBLY_ACC=CAM_ASM_000279 /TAXON_ID=36767 /ORGANISM="Euplotes focardii, Strain TN1" /LENGTH=894 /DNA_ID=CAMNT_0053128317 /DNA_START=39 /DNA_END=2723 /DNA_ORIENTATION=+
MPSLPSSSLFSIPFGDIMNKSKGYVVGAMTYLMYKQRARKASEILHEISFGVSPVDVGLLPHGSDFTTLATALGEITYAVGNSVQSAFKGRKVESLKVLVYGRQSKEHAQTLSSLPGFPAQLVRLTARNERDIGGGIFWTADRFVLNSLPDTSKFDAILCFDMDRSLGLDYDKADSYSKQSELAMTRLVVELSRVLKPGGCIAGTGLFNGQQDTDPLDPAVWEDGSAVGCELSIRGMRDLLETRNLEVHCAMDMTMEGQLVFRNNGNAKDKEVIDMVQEGDLLCGRFLASKPRVEDVSYLKHNVMSVIAEPRALTDLKQRLQEEGPSLMQQLSKVAAHDGDEPTDDVAALRSRANSCEALVGMCLGLLQDDEQDAKPRQRAASVAEVKMVVTDLVDKALDTPRAGPKPLRLGVSGVSLGLPNGEHPERSVFDAENFQRVFRGENFISRLTESDHEKMLKDNIFQIQKKEGKRIKKFLTEPSSLVQLCSKIVDFDLSSEYGIPPAVVNAMDTTYQLAVAAGLEALRDAGIPLTASVGGKDNRRPTLFGLPEDMRNDTGVIFASSFPALDSCVEEVRKNTASKVRREAGLEPADSHSYEYDRKLLFKLLVMANSQLAELIKARGPNTQINSACASTTQAIAIAEDWMRTGRCRRVVVVSADNATSDNLLEYIGTGFLALGAATTCPILEDAAAPFDCRRKGMILGCGAAGLVLETAAAAAERGWTPKSELLGSHHVNSAFHASLIDNAHVAEQFKQFLERMSKVHGLDLDEVAKECIYYSHETCTSANGGCARAEMEALEHAFGPVKKNIMIANTKAFTGHPMAVGIEDVIAVESLHTGLVPPIPNHKKTDPRLGQITLAQGGTHTRQFVLRFAAGFGSQSVMLLFRKWQELQAGA